MTSADSARLRAAMKGRDGWWAHFVVGPLANRIVGWIAPLSWITPNRVTVFSLAVGLLGAGLFAIGRQPALAAGAIILQVSFLLDCVDGQLSRYRDTSSLFGAVLDRLCDRVKLFGVTLGIAEGLFRLGADGAVFRLALVYVFCEYMMEVYVTTYRRFEAGAAARPGRDSAGLDAARFLLRVLDLPIVRLGFADRYFLMSAFMLLGAARPLLWLLAGLGILQVGLRPIYNLVGLRSRFGDWPWNDERRHQLGQNF